MTLEQPFDDDNPDVSDLDRILQLEAKNPGHMISKVRVKAVGKLCFITVLVPFARHRCSMLTVCLLSRGLGHGWKSRNPLRSQDEGSQRQRGNSEPSLRELRRERPEGLTTTSDV